MGMHRMAVERRRARAWRARNIAAGLTAAGKPRKDTFDRLAYLETEVAEGGNITTAAAGLGVEPLSVQRYLERHDRTDLWYALKGDTITWKRGTR